MIFRKAAAADLAAVSHIYDLVHTAEEQGTLTVGWVRGVYPTADTAQDSLNRDDLFVAEENGVIAATAIINHLQPECYLEGNWAHDAPDDRVMVLHTLAVDPNFSKRGCGTAFVAFYEQYAKDHGCPYLRMDTQIINLTAQALYKKLGYRQIGTVPCVFNGIEGVQLVLLEKKL